MIRRVPGQGSKGRGHDQRLSVGREALIVTPPRKGCDGDTLRAGDHGEV